MSPDMANTGVGVGKGSKDYGNTIGLAGMVVDNNRYVQKVQDQAQSVLTERDTLRSENAQLKSDLETAKASASDTSLQDIEDQRNAKKAEEEKQAKAEEDQKKADEDARNEESRRRRLAGGSVLTSPGGVTTYAKLGNPGVTGY